MKKVFLSILLTICTIALTNAQQNAIGLRLGFNRFGVAEASYQRFVSDRNRFELDLGLDTGNSIHVSGIYQWVWDLSQLEQGFKWYAGPGVGLFLHESGMKIGLLGNLGIEYTFEFPLQVFIDIRPGFYTGKTDNIGGFATGARWKF